MNIFILDYDMTKNAQYHVDKHIVKMPLEATQLLSTVVNVTESIGFAPVHIKNIKNITHVHGYKPTHINHPCAIWARSSKSNYDWLKEYAKALFAEYTYRYDKIMKTEEVFYNLPDPILPDLGLTEFAQCMPEIYKHKDIVEAYRNYYAFEKHNLFSWKKREQPEWL